MFCMKCGAKIADDAVFCLNCGTKVATEQVSLSQTSNESVTPAEEVVQPVVADSSSVVNEAAPQQPVAEQTSQQQPSYQPVFNRPSFNQPVYQQPVQPVFQQPVQQMPVRKGSKAVIPAVIFLILSVFASIMISVSSFIDGKVGIGVENIGFAVASVLIIVYAVSKSTVSSVLKGAGLLVATVLHVIFFGVSAFMACFDIFGNAEAGIDYYYAVILLLELICFYVYMLVNIIRSFINCKKASSVMLLFGYISALLIIVAFVIDMVSDINGLFAFKFIPVDLGLVFMIFGDIFAVVARVKKQEQ